MVYYQNGELLAFVELKYGQRGIWVQPFVHPDAEDVQQILLDLFSKIPNRRSRPVYICVRSYQSWLELAIEELGGEAGPRQAVMVKQLVTPQKVWRACSPCRPWRAGSRKRLHRSALPLHTWRVSKTVCNNRK